jgi:hypothetical protein
MDLGTLRHKLTRDYENLQSWQLVADRWNITKPMAFRIATTDYEPKDHHIRFHLGLPAFVETTVCEKCGELHKLDGICPTETPVDIVVYEVDDNQLEELKSSRALVKVIRKRPRRRKPSRPRVRVELPADLTPDERAIIMKLTPEERKNRLLGKEQR